MKTLASIIRDLRALQAAQRSGSPTRLRLTWKKSPAARTLASIAERTERTHQQPAPPVRRVDNILADLAKKNEAKVK